MRVKAWVDGQRCQGHTLCAMIAPESFELNDIDGTASPVRRDVADEHQPAVLEAARSCPEQAISLDYEGMENRL